MPLNAVVVPDPLRDRVERFTGREVETDDVTFRGFVLLVGVVVSSFRGGREKGGKGGNGGKEGRDALEEPPPHPARPTPH